MNLPFRKKPVQTAPTMPPEVQQYYQAERRERTWVAWLLAIATLLVTVAIIVALFFAGRWVYRKVKHNDKPSTTSQTQPSDTSKNQSGSNQSSNGSTSGSGSSGGTSNQGSTNTNGSTPTPPATTSPSTGGVVTPDAARTSIPNTGPGDTVALFFAVSVVGYLLHRFVLAKD